MTENININPEIGGGNDSNNMKELQDDGADAEIIDFQGLDWAIERNLKNIEYQKFYLGLSSGALVFSITFAQKIGPSSAYSWIKIAGWVSLLLSIFFELSSIRSFIGIADNLHTVKGWFKGGKIDEKKFVEMVNPADMSEQYIKRFLLDDASVRVLAEQFHDKEYKQMTQEELEEFRRRAIEDKELNKKVKTYMSKHPDKRVSHLYKTIFGFDTLTKHFRSKPLDELNKIKNALYVTIIYDVVGLFSFYVGMLLISIYTIIRFIH